MWEMNPDVRLRCVVQAGEGSPFETKLHAGQTVMERWRPSRAASGLQRRLVLLLDFADVFFTRLLDAGGALRAIRLATVLFPLSFFALFRESEGLMTVSLSRAGSAGWKRRRNDIHHTPTPEEKRKSPFPSTRWALLNGSSVWPLPEGGWGEGGERREQPSPPPRCVLFQRRLCVSPAPAGGWGERGSEAPDTANTHTRRGEQVTFFTRREEEVTYSLARVCTFSAADKCFSSASAGRRAKASQKRQAPNTHTRREEEVTFFIEKARASPATIGWVG